jgi:L-ascorbate metabolism protein UlaG (beta-lactamase superfamily)
MTRHLRSLTVTAIGGPTLVLDIAGLRLVTDPTFDPPGDHPIGARVLTKTAPPALPAAQVGPLAAVLLSHDQHPDNLDHAGRELLRTAPVTLTTAAAAQRLGGTSRALPPWTSVDLARPDGAALRVTGVPAQHGPDGTEHLTGPVTGFVLTGPGLPTVYVSGDNASLDVVVEVAARVGPVDVAILFAGGAKTPLLGDAYLTLGSAMAAEAARLLGAKKVVVVHADGWTHFTEPGATVPPVRGRRSRARARADATGRGGAAVGDAVREPSAPVVRPGAATGYVPGMWAVGSLLLIAAMTLLVTRVATVVLTATGLPRHVARFQARSALTGSGFTTRESEAVVDHPVRRRVIALLMLLGSVGLVGAASSAILGLRGAASGAERWRLVEPTGGLLALVFTSRSRWVDRKLTAAIGYVL